MRVSYICVVAAALLSGCAARDTGPWNAVIARYEQRLASRPDEPAESRPTPAPSNPQFAIHNPKSTWGLIDELGPEPGEVHRFVLVEAPDGDKGRAPTRKRRTAPGWGKGKPGQLEYVPWRDRVGRAYPDHFWPSLGRWGQEMPATLWDDAKSTVTNRYSLVALAAAGVAGAAIASSDLDDRVENHYTKHGSQLGEDLDGLTGFLGNPALHLPGAFVYVIAATATEDEQVYENATTLLNALCVNGIATQGLKWTLGGESPNGDEMGWPSGHSSSSFCLATVLYHQHGPWVGVPMLGFATFVAYQRVDARNHDFSDVVSGSLIGIAIGHAVASGHEMRVLGMDVVPYADPQTGGIGVALLKQW